MMHKISALVITFNEEKNIQNYLESISFADEIIVVDSYSTDKTVDIIKSFENVQLYQRKFDDFPSQKNYAISLASYQWIMFFDADERISPKLKEEIISEINHSQNEYTAYYVKRIWHFMGDFLRYSGFQNDYVIRIFKKSKGYYDQSQYVHEKLIVDGESKYLKEFANHFSYENYDKFNAKLTKYVKLQADELYERGVRPNFFYFFIKPLFRFIHHYIFRFGFLDGFRGFIIAYIYGFSIVKRYMFLWMKYRKIN